MYVIAADHCLAVGQGMVEFYVDDVLSLPVTLHDNVPHTTQGGKLSGVFATVGQGVHVSAAHHLSNSLVHNHYLAL
jgi:hypothetical protein